VTSLAVVGTDHLHVVDLVTKLSGAGADVRVIVPSEDRIGPWLAKQFPDARADGTYDDDIDVVVTAAIPSERAQIGIDAMRAGKNVVADKPGAISHEQLGALRAAHAETGRQYTVIFAERLGSPAMMHAQRLVESGRIGMVVHTIGLGPHSLSLQQRPPWFFDRARYGGILVDIGSHQVDQFLAFTGATDAQVVAARVRAHADHPGLEVLGEMMLATETASGYTRVDYFTPAGLGAWGDVRFTVVGTEGYVEVQHVPQTVLVVDGERAETIVCADEPVDWPDRCLAGTLMTQEHAFTVTRLCLDAQRQARPGNEPAASV
jgi:predicted dehydrogenase